jgi:hypothetical protein
VRLVERPFSDLLRHPRDVTSDIQPSDVLLHRRGEPDLRLSLADREADRAATTALLKRALRTVAVHNPAELVGALREVLPWVEFLPAADRMSFLDELSRTIVASAELDNFAAVSQLLREWRVTADVHADPEFGAPSQPVPRGQGSRLADDIGGAFARAPFRTLGHARA